VQIPNNIETIKQRNLRTGFLQAYRVMECSGYQISKQWAHKDCKFVSSTHWPPLPLPPWNIPGCSFQVEA